MVRIIPSYHLNKKASSGGYTIARKMIFWMFIMVIITIAIIALVFLLGGYQNSLANIPGEFKAEVISSRFLENPDCFAYVDPITQRTYPNVMDLQKVTREQIDACYYTGEEAGYKEIQFELFLPSKNIRLATNDFFKKVDFTLRETVLLRDGDTIEPALLILYVQETTRIQGKSDEAYT